MRVSSWSINKRVAGSIRTRIKVMFPLSCLLLTCCMGETTAIARQDVESSAKPVIADAATLQQAQAQPAAQLARSVQSPNQANQDLSDVVSEGRFLVAEKSSKADAKKSKSVKDAPPAKRLDASKEEEEDDEDEEDAAEDNSGKGSGGLGKRSIQADFDKNVTASLKEVVARGAVLSVAVSLTFQGGKDKKESESLSTSETGKYTHVLDYETGTEYPIKKIDGFSSGRLHQGQEEKTLRATFEAPPKNVKTIGITIYGVGTFDDVKLGGGPLASSPKGKVGKPSGKPSGSSDTKAKEEEEEDEDDEDEDEEDDDKGLAGKGRKDTGKKGK